MPDTERPSGGRAWRLLLRVLLLAAAFLFPLVLMSGKSATFDEVAHLPAGYSYLSTGIFKVNPQHPPLVKEICALPLLFLDVKMPVDREALERNPIPLTYQWGFGKQFLYSQDADRLLFWGRIPAIALSAGLAALVMIWAGRLWGKGAALLGLFLYVFDPTLTAHAQLVTTDVGLAFFATLFLYLLRRYTERRTWKRLLASGAALGLALGAKFSAVILVPMAVLLLGLAAWRPAGSAPPGEAAGAGDARRGKSRRTAVGNVSTPPRDEGRAARVVAAMGASGVLLVVAGLVVWAIYFFPTDPLFYLKGFQAVNRDHSPDYLPYLMGEMKPGGWRSYLLIAWLVKTPIPSLVLLGAALVLCLRGLRAGGLDELFLAIPAVGFFAGYSLTADNLGVRYLIPCFPFFFIFTSRLAPALAKSGRWAKGAVAALLIWQAAEFASIWPDHLSYFNQIAGGSRNGLEWLDDSNLDWGQGLIQLREYLAANRVSEYRFCYFGSGDPAYYGIRGARVSSRDLLAAPEPGTWILSAHCIARARAQLSRLHGEGSGNWLARAVPRDVVGHAYYVYEIKEGAESLR